MSGVVYDIIIVGGGAAGLTAALYATRQGLKTLVVAKDIGGQLTLASQIENYPGIKAIAGLELAQSIKEQAEEFGAEFVYDEAIGISQLDNAFRISTKVSGDYDALAVILAFGKTPRSLGVPGEDRLVGRGVSYCAICDAPLFRGKKVAVVGWGEHAFKAVKVLRAYGNKVYIIHRGEAKLTDEELVRESESMNVVYMPNSVVLEIKGDTRVRSIVLKNAKTGEEGELEVDGVFVEMGYTAKTDWVKGFVQLNENGEIVTDKLGMTSRPGVFAAGDVTDILYKQAVIAAAQGAIAALSAYNYIQRLRGLPTKKSDWD
ncbi:MAG: FAD-dependent oxidoreductase [Thaumarchaeota archaeon]|jgi:thioredoxin reductase (NADPH)|nr:FAD-dependent oxidoreductase [Candidatus Terraquivivens yellowstonensis]MCL7401107.1 FAD-dependent oxidoreductase [Candidatus Terraquivivens yellowstonensis]